MQGLYAAPADEHLKRDERLPRRPSPMISPVALGCICAARFMDCLAMTLHIIGALLIKIGCRGRSTISMVENFRDCQVFVIIRTPILRTVRQQPLGPRVIPELPDM